MSRNKKKKRLNIKRLLILLLAISFLIFAYFYFGISKNIESFNLIDRIKNFFVNEKENDKLSDYGYSEDEISVIRDNMEEEEINQIDNYYENLSEFSKISYFHEENIDRYENLLKNSNYSIEEVVMRVNTNIDQDFYTNIKTIEDPDSVQVLVNKYYAFPEGFVPSNLVQIEGVKMKEEAADALELMIKDMRDEGYSINLVSGYRSEETQRNLYNRYAASDGYDEADTYSARPSHSEHQSGLAIDVSDGWYLEDYFEDTEEFEWLKENAYKYGFIMRYPKDKVYMTGYVYEPWHYRFVGKEIASIIQKENITYEEYCVLYRGYY